MTSLRQAFTARVGTARETYGFPIRTVFDGESVSVAKLSRRRILCPFAARSSPHFGRDPFTGLASSL